MNGSSARKAGSASASRAARQSYPDDVSEASSNALSRQDSIASSLFTVGAAAGTRGINGNGTGSASLRSANMSIDTAAVDAYQRGMVTSMQSPRTPYSQRPLSASSSRSTTKKQTSVVKTSDREAANGVFLKAGSNLVATGGGGIAMRGEQVPHHKAGRVKVGIRCRPAFQDEIDFAQGNFFSIVDCKPSDAEQSSMGYVSLTLLSGKQRDFMFDYIFDSNSTQDYVYDKIARPVVTDVLRGFNGTIFAYGQTGTGKTYTMGILEFVNNEHSGIIPRSISQIFEYVEEKADQIDITVSLSFLQLYRETIQDLLAPANAGDKGTSSVANEENLAIREDPARGFYVEGLQEFQVRNYSEAEALLNLGLENRAIAPTLMNATSSRSHTVLTISIKQRGLPGQHGYHSQSHSNASDATSPIDSMVGSTARTVHSKLLMVDLAGSERVRRTVSKGARLSEAKSINTSLSALGNVIAALADAKSSSTHIPYRDSKLTRLLQDSLGGTASTALVATVGPAPVNYGETLSTLTFAARCMAVKTTPIQHEEVDYGELCAQLQEKVSSMEGEWTAKMIEQQERFEAEIEALNSQLEERGISPSATRSGAHLNSAAGDNHGTGFVSFDSAGLALIFNHIATMASAVDAGTSAEGGPSLRSSKDWISSVLSDLELSGGHHAPHLQHTFQLLVSLLAYCYELIAAMCTDTTLMLRANCQRQTHREEHFESTLQHHKDAIRLRDLELARMTREDPLLPLLRTQHVEIGHHLQGLTPADALSRVDNKFKSNNPLPFTFTMEDLDNKLSDIDRLPFMNHLAINELVHSFMELHRALVENMGLLSGFMDRKDSSFDALKEELADQLVERRKREEEVINWSYILKYLLRASSKMRDQLRIAGKSTQDLLLENSRHMVENEQRREQLQPDGNSGRLAKLYARINHTDRAIALNKETAQQAHNGSDHLVGQSTGNSSRNGSNTMTNSSRRKNGGSTGRPLAKGSKQQSRLTSQIDDDDEYDQLAEEDHGHGNRQAGSRYRQRSQYDDDAYEDEDEYEDINGTEDGNNEYEGEDVDDDGEIETSPSVADSDIASSTNMSFHSAATVHSIPLKVKYPPSLFAQGVVQELGVEGTKAVTAMKVIDQVSKITPELLRSMDPATRAQIMEIRRQLGIDEKLKQLQGQQKKTITRQQSVGVPSPAMSASSSFSSTKAHTGTVNRVRSSSAPRPRTASFPTMDPTGGPGGSNGLTRNRGTNDSSNGGNNHQRTGSSNGRSSSVKRTRGTSEDDFSGSIGVPNRRVSVGLSSTPTPNHYKQQQEGYQQQAYPLDTQSESGRARLMAEAHRLQRNAGTTPINLNSSTRMQQRSQPPSEASTPLSSSSSVAGFTFQQYATPDIPPTFRGANPLMSNTSSTGKAKNPQQQHGHNRQSYNRDSFDDDFSQLDEIDDGGHQQW